MWLHVYIYAYVYAYTCVGVILCNGRGNLFVFRTFRPRTSKLSTEDAESYGAEALVQDLPSWVQGFVPRVCSSCIALTVPHA